MKKETQQTIAAGLFLLVMIAAILGILGNLTPVSSRLERTKAKPAAKKTPKKNTNKQPARDR